MAVEAAQRIDDRTPTTAQPAGSRWQVVVFSLTIVATAAVLHLAGLGGIPFHTKGEPREAVLVQDVIGSGRFTLPLRNGYEMPRKPPMFHWLGSLSAAIAGTIDERSVRLPSALQSCAAALLLLAAASARGRPLLGFFSALVLLSSFEWSRSATAARIDMTLALGTTASFVGLTLVDQRFRRLGLCLLYGGMIWGTLAKGPVGIVLPTLCMALLVLVEAGLRWVVGGIAVCLVAVLAVGAGASQPVVLGLALGAGVAMCATIGFRAVHFLAPHFGYPIVGIVVGTWYALASHAGGSEFIELQILAENVGRFLGTSSVAVGHAHGVGYLVGAFIGGFMPWTLFVPPAVLCAATERDPPARALLRHSAVWIAVVFTFFSLSSSKRSVYLLPMYPAASLVVGHWMVRLTHAVRERPYVSTVGAALGLTLALIGAAVAAFFGLQATGLDILAIFVEPLAGLGLGADGAARLVAGLAARTMPIVVISTALALAALATAAFASRQRWPHFLACMFATSFTLLVLVQRGILPAVAAASTREERARFIREVASDRTVTLTPALDYGFAFYMGGAVPIVDPAQPGRLGTITMMSRPAWRALPVSSRLALEPIPSMSLPKQSNQVEMIAVQRVGPR